MDKLIKSVNSLKQHYGNHGVVVAEKTSKENVSLTPKERQTDCKIIADSVTQNNVKSNADFNGILSVAVETLLQVCGDEDSNVRMTADECLNRVCSGMQEAHIGKLLLEFYKEVKRNGSSRSVRAAIVRFSSLCHRIRPNKCRPFIINLLPALSDVLKREDDVIHECLPQSLMVIFKVLRVFINDNELRSFMNVLIENLAHSSATIRRTSASVLQATVKYANKPVQSVKKLTHVLLDKLHAMRTDKHLVLGVLTSLRHMLMVLAVNEDDEEEATEEVKQIFEACIYHCLTNHNSVCTSALETMQELLALPAVYLSWIQNTSAFSAGNTLFWLTQNSASNLPDILVGIEEEKQDPNEEVSPPPVVDDLSVDEDELKTFNIHGIPSSETSKLLTRRYLLSSTAGCLSDDRKVRVSVKALALSCISSLVKISPAILLMKLQESSEQAISDVLLYSNHADPRMRGITANLAGNLIKSALVMARNPAMKDELAPVCAFIHEACDIIKSCLFDESNAAVKEAVSAIANSLDALLNSQFYNLGIDLIFCLLSIMPNAYWLTKVDALDVLTNIDFYVICYHSNEMNIGKTHNGFKQVDDLQTMVFNEVLQSLNHDDVRVRNQAANKIARLVQRIIFTGSSDPVDVITMNMYKRSCTMFDCVATNCQSVPTVMQQYHRASDRSGATKPVVADNLSHVITRISNQMFLSQSKSSFHGCLSALLNLSNKYPISQYGAAWGCGVVPEKHNGKERDEKMGFLPMLLCYFNSTWLSSDLAIHSDLLLLVGNYLTGLVIIVLKSKEDLTQDPQPLGHEADMPSVVGEVLSTHVKDFFKHLTQILAMFHYTITGHSPIANKVLLPSISAPSLTSPMKKKDKLPKVSSQPTGSLMKDGSLQKTQNTTKDENDKEKTKFVFGSFVHIPEKLKLFELVKSTYDIYKSTTCADDNDRFLHFVTSTMDTYCQLLEVLAFPEVSVQIEEILTFVNTVFKVQPTMTVLCIEQLLKALFGNNLLSAWESKEKREQAKKENQSVNVGPSMLTQQPTFYHYVYQYPLNQLTMTVANASFHHYLQSEGQQKPTKGWFVSIKKKMERKLSLSSRGGSSESSSVQSYIRLFESIVIRSLKTYTITASVQVQIHVLNLLSQLVQLRVNYCLLDADQIFIGFIIKQFELIESGQISQSEELVPNIFFFLVLLSYECYHSKTVITMPTIIQLCDRIMASGRNSFTHAVPALRPLIHDLFVARGPNKQETNTILLTQQEVVQSMLLRILQFPQVIRMVTTVLHHYRKEDTNRWKKFSRQVTDLLLPMLKNMQMKISSVSDVSLLHCLFEALSPIALRPVDLLLNAMLTSPIQLDSLRGHQQWLVKLLVLHRVLLYHFKENVIMERIQQLGVKPDVVQIRNLLKLSNVEVEDEEKIVTKEEEEANILALTWLQSIAFTCVRLSQELCNPSTTWGKRDNRFLVQLLSESLLVLTYTIKSGTFTNFAKSCRNFLQSNSSSSNGFYSSSEITQQFILLSSEHPVLLLLWQQFLFHVKILSQETWKQIEEFNNHCNQDTPDYATPHKKMCNLNLSAVQYGSLIAFAEHFSQGNLDMAFVKFVLSDNLLNLLSLNTEPPVQDFMAVLKNNKELEKHLVDKLLDVIHDGRVKMDSKLRAIGHLFSCYGSNEVDMAAMLEFCAKLIDKKVLKFVVKFVYRLLASRIHLLIECKPSRPSDVVGGKIKLFRHSVVESKINLNMQVINKLAIHIHMKEEENVMNTKEILPNESWYESVVQKHGQTTQLPLSEFGDIVGILEEGKIADILHNEGKINIHFGACLRFAVKEITKPIPSEDGVRLYNAMMTVTRIQLKSCMEKYPQIGQVGSFGASDDAWQSLRDGLSDSEDYLLFRAFCEMMNEHLLHLHLLPMKYRFTDEELKQGLMAAVVFGKILQCCHLHTSPMASDDAVAYLRCVSRLISVTTIDRRHDSIIFAIANTYIEMLENYIGNIKYSEILPTECVEKLSGDNVKTLNQIIGLPRLVTALETNGQKNFKHLSSELQIHFTDALWYICRCDTFNSTIRVPSFVWKMGWEPDTVFPKIPEPPGQYLQEKDVLADYVARINFLGYKNRTQFEETWTNLLGVLVSQPVAESIETGKHPEDEEVEVSCLAIRGLTSLVLQTRSQTAHSSHHPTPEQSNIKVKHVLAGRQMLLPQNILHREVQDKLSHEYSQATNHRFHLPWNGLNFLEQDNFLKWLELKTGHVHAHQTQYEIGQFSLSHLHHVLGLNVDVTQHDDGGFVDVFDEECSLEAEKVKPKEEPEVDVHSCVQFLVDLFTDWFRIIGTPNQQGMEPMFNVPRQLICECIRSILLISDFFTERRQFDWMFSALQFFTGNLEISDEIILQYLVVALAKAGAVLGMEAEVCDVVTTVIQTALSSNLLSCQLHALLGASYALQCEAQLHMQPLITNLHTFVAKQMNDIRNLSMQNIEFIRIVMSLAFRMIEKWNNFFTHEFIEEVVQTCLCILSEVTCTDGVLEVCVCHGLQRLVLMMLLTRAQCHLLSKLMSRKLQNDAPGVQLNLMLALLLTCMYNERLRSSEEDETDVEKAVEMRLIMMEHTTTLLSRVRNGIPEDCLIICRILPPLLDHFFSPQDVLNKVIGEFASSRQPFPHLMATVLFEVFQLLHSRDQGGFVREWVMLSLGNFVQRTPLSTAIWSLTCIFICASTNPWLKPLLPFVPASTNCDECSSQQIEFLCMTAADFFFNQLTEELDRRSFQSTFQSFSNTADSPYSKLLNHLGINGGNKDLLA